jgi:patatin-related protein
MAMDQATVTGITVNTGDQDVDEEVRIGAVLYGGVSLCIYINGVSQELLRLVEATAKDAVSFSGTRELYRKLAMLSSQDAGKDAVKRWNGLAKTGGQRRRFIIDALSGTSAGGINAVFLAKALAKGQSLDGTKAFWIEEGGIERLINDSESCENIEPRLKLEKHPASLLNSQRMYGLLLNALNQMDDASPQAKPALVKEVDLYITATDLDGRKVSIPLADQVVAEKDYHQAFHFSFQDGSQAGSPHGRPRKAEGDFDQDWNPYLAFAARCTSAFPIAFEPMRGQDAQDQLESQRKAGFSDEGWKRFLEKNVRFGKDEDGAAESAASEGKNPKADGFRNRSFGDGGILDNKPFAYIMESLASRTSAPMVERKLIYVDPSPENPEAKAAAGKPDVLAYGLKALTGLPAYEGIRGDINGIIDRNRLIDKVNRITGGIAEDLAALHIESEADNPELRDPEWENKGLREMLEERKIAYGGYHRLKILLLTEEWTGAIAKALDWQDHPWRLSVLRELFRAWRAGKYRLMSGEGRPTENKFLCDFDFSFRKRRLSFVLEKADALFRLDPKATVILGEAAKKLPEDETSAEWKNFKQEIRRIKQGLKDAREHLQKEEAELFLDDGISGLAALLERFRKEFLETYQSEEPAKARTGNAGAIVRDDSGALNGLKSKPEKTRKQDLERFFADSGSGKQLVATLDELMVKMQAKLKAVFARASTRCRESVGAGEAGKEGSAGGLHPLVRKALRTFYLDFDHFDMVLFPLTFCTEMGEGSRVAVHRISPMNLIADGANGKISRPELAGESFGHFGAFLQKGWRRNDLLWGRLDAVEKFIDMLLPAGWGPEARSQILAEGRNAVLEEELSAAIETSLKKSLVEGFMDSSAALGNADPAAGEAVGMQGKTRALLSPKEIRKLADPLSISIGDSLRQTLFQKFAAQKITNHDVLAHRPAMLDRELFLKVLARSALVSGKMLDGLAARRGISNPLTGGLIYLSRIFWGLVEMSFPSAGNVAGNILRKLVFQALLTCLVIAVLASVFNVPGLSSLAWKFFAVILAVDLLRFGILGYAKRWNWKPLLILLALLPAAGGLIYGAAHADAIHGLAESITAGLRSATSAIRGWFYP